MATISLDLAITGEAIRAEQARSDQYLIRDKLMRKLITLGASLLLGLAVAVTTANASQYYDMASQSWKDVNGYARGGKSPIKRTTVKYDGAYANSPAGTIVINTKERRLYYLMGDGKAVKYGIGGGTPRLPVDRHPSRQPQGGMAGMDSSSCNAQARTQSSCLYGRWPEQPAGRSRHVYRFYDLSHSWFQRTVEHRSGPFLLAASVWPMKT